MIPSPSSVEPVSLSLSIVASCLAVFAVALLPLLIAEHMLRRRGAARLHRIVSAVVLACLILTILGGVC